jgi:hypothetical protein
MGCQLGGRGSLQSASPDATETLPRPFTHAPPAFPVATGWLWWLVVATEGAAAEGSWGREGSGAERQGPGPGGSSGVCGIAAKCLVNTCML